MTIPQIVLAFAGTVILTSVALAVTVSPAFLWVAAFVGANLLQSAFTRVCPLAWLLRKAGARDGVPAWR